MGVLLVPNVNNPGAVSAVAEVATWLSAQSIEPVLEMSDAAACGLVDFGRERFEIGEPELVVSFGGDGTIMKAVHYLGEHEVPVLGINMGRLGFLTAAGPGEAREAIASALAGEIRLQRRATVRATVVTDAGERQWRAFNEVFVGRSQHTRVVGMTIRVDGVKLAQVRADGVIVATATGSTAYALSAGGPIAAPEFGGMLLVPVAPHTLASRSLVTGPASVVDIELDPVRAEACITIDGSDAPCLAPIRSVQISRHPTDVLLAHADDRTFYHAIADEFFGV
ncbi:MAG: NAD(+)/NADH kinase [Coriobacteriales bacterium]|nr:NAD(+)/NADH kinase [Coriobacteriales bacterium]